MRIGSIGMRAAAMALASVGMALPSAGQIVVEAVAKPARRQRLQAATALGQYPVVRLNRSRHWRDEPGFIASLPMAQRYRWARQEAIATLHTVQNTSVR